MNNEQTFGKGHPRAEIIDGQQRLTTLQIFLCALKRYAKEIDNKFVCQITKDLTVNPVYEGFNEEECLKIWPTNSDREQFKKIVDNENSNGVMGKAYDFFYDKIKDFSSENNHQQDKLSAITEVIRNFLKLVKIELENEDDPQIIFETLNARGKPLLASDLIKNYIFMKIFKKGGNADKLYEQYWQEFDSRPDNKKTSSTGFWYVEERQGRLTRPRIDLFMFHYLTMKTSEQQTKSPIKVEHLYKEFKTWYEAHYKEKTEDFLKDLSKYRDYYITLIEPKNETRLDQFAKRLKALDTATLYPVLLYLMDLPKDILPTKEMDEIATHLESWLVRRDLCRDTTAQNYNRFFVGLLNKLKKIEESGQNPSQCILEELAQSTSNTTKWPNDEDFREVWMNRAVYNKNYERCLMILKALNLYLHTDKSEKVNWDETKISIEHLLPQKADGKLYPYSQNSSLKKEEENQEEFRSHIIHTIGNLTLLTQSLNPSISNGPFCKKAKEISKNSDLRINSEFRDENTSKSWDEESIEKRGERLFKSALEIWPRPEC